jgi:uncharacterized ion transporter superfamily protein YfcC
MREKSKNLKDNSTKKKVSNKKKVIFVLICCALIVLVLWLIVEVFIITSAICDFLGGELIESFVEFCHAMSEMG